MRKYGVIGDGLAASVFKELDDFEVVHRDGWEDKIDGWQGVVNFAGLTSRIQCLEVPFTEAIEANVNLPLRIYEATQDRAKPIRFIACSSCSVYKRPPYHGPDWKIGESSYTHPTHAYNASKILMETVLKGRANCFIFRLPRIVTNNGHPRDFDKHSGAWKQVEDRHCTICDGETLIKSVRRALSGTATPDIYNIASEVIHVPSYIQDRYGWDGEVVPADAMPGLGPWVVLSTEKARRNGLL